MTTETRPFREEVIASRNHPAVKKIRALHHRGERERTGLFYAEGVRFVAEAVQRGVHIETLVFAPDLLKSAFAQHLVRRQRRAGTKCLEVAPEVLHSLAQNDDPQGIGAVVRQHWEALERVDPGDGLCWLALETVQSPGNLGTMVRTADAVGAAGIIAVGDSIDAYDSAAVRASMGAVFSQRFVRTSLARLVAWKQRHGCLVVGTSPAAAQEYDAIAYRRPLVLLMGGERKGLPSEQQAVCDAMVCIPMVGRSDSLNLAVATGVMLYQIFRDNRRQCPASPVPAFISAKTPSDSDTC